MVPLVVLLPAPGGADGRGTLAFKIHAVAGMALFIVWPFTRLVHAFSAPIGYVFRPYVVYRDRGPHDAGNRQPRGVGEGRRSVTTTTSSRSKARWRLAIPGQHGAWAFLVIPLILGFVIVGWSVPGAVFSVAWVLAYPASYYLGRAVVVRWRRGNWSRIARRELNDAVPWAVLAAIPSLILLVMRPWLVWVGWCSVCCGRSVSGSPEPAMSEAPATICCWWPRPASRCRCSGDRDRHTGFGDRGCCRPRRLDCGAHLPGLLRRFRDPCEVVDPRGRRPPLGHRLPDLPRAGAVDGADLTVVAAAVRGLRDQGFAVPREAVPLSSVRWRSWCRC